MAPTQQGHTLADHHELLTEGLPAMLRHMRCVPDASIIYLDAKCQHHMLEDVFSTDTTIMLQVLTTCTNWFTPLALLATIPVNKHISMVYRFSSASFSHITFLHLGHSAFLYDVVAGDALVLTCYVLT
jgi:hypothetical protein